jgi:putative RecB family exonuclease
VTTTARRTPTPSNLWSFSRLKTFDQCALRYQYRYLQGHKEAFRSIESFLGNVVHDVLEWLYKERDQDAKPGLEATLEQFAEGWTESRGDDVAIIRIGDEEEKYLRLGREMLDRFHRGSFTRDRSRTVSLEKRLTVRLSPHVVFTGFADRVGRTENGRLFVVDYKTSRSEGDSSEFSEGLQAPLYAACLLDEHRDDEALAGYHYLRHGTTRWQAVDRARSHVLLERARELATLADRATDFPARPGILCAWCGFNAVCPQAQVPEGLSGGQRLATGLL